MASSSSYCDLERGRPRSTKAESQHDYDDDDDPLPRLAQTAGTCSVSPCAGASSLASFFGASAAAAVVTRHTSRRRSPSPPVRPAWSATQRQASILLSLRARRGIPTEVLCDLPHHARVTGQIRTLWLKSCAPTTPPARAVRPRWFRRTRGGFSGDAAMGAHAATIQEPGQPPARVPFTIIQAESTVSESRRSGMR